MGNPTPRLVLQFNRNCSEKYREIRFHRKVQKISNSLLATSKHIKKENVKKKYLKTRIRKQSVFPAMRSYMNLQILLERKLLLAHRTLILRLANMQPTVRA